MAINLATKYSDKIASSFSIHSVVEGRVSTMFDFTGVKGLKVYTPVTVPMSDYVRSGQNRYGSPSEMQDTVQELVMTKDRGFSLIIDKGNNEEQMLSKSAGQMLSLQIAERVVPEVDKYALDVFVNQAGKVASIAATPTADNIISEIGKAASFLDDNYVPLDGRVAVVPTEVYNLIRTAPEYVGVEALGEKALAKGSVGEIFGMELVKAPKSYLPDDCYMVVWHKSSVLSPNKIKDAKLHTDPPGISGALIEGRWLYDAFVLGARSGGVYSLVLSSKKQATPTFSGTTTITITSSGASEIKYTVDGTDPRYSPTAVTYGSGITASTLPSGYTLKAVAYSGSKYPSDVATN